MSQDPQSQGNRLDPWFDAYADRAHNLRASEIRALFSVVSRPEVVSLAGGMPNLKDLPLESLADCEELDLDLWRSGPAVRFRPRLGAPA